MAEEGHRVLLNVYDLSQGLAKQLSNTFLGKVIEGIWHTGIVVYGNEYYFGGGVHTCRQGLTPYGRPLKAVELGFTRIPKQMFEDYLQEIRPRYTEQTYNLLHHNCNNFSEEIAQFLLGVSIPECILKLPEEVMKSPMGALIMPMIQQLETTLRYGGVPQIPHTHGSEVPKLEQMSAANFPASNIRMNDSRHEVPSKEVSKSTTSAATAMCTNGATAAPKTERGKPLEKKIDLLGEARTQVQEEITKEFAALMAEGRLRASEAAALATRRVMERHGRGVGLTSES